MAFLARQCRSKARFLEMALLRPQSVAVRGFATGTQPAEGAGDGDIVLEAFREQQQAYRTILDGLKTVQVPLGLEPQAVKKFAGEMEALKKKAGVPDQQELIDASLDFSLDTSGGDLRKFITDAVSQLEMGSNLAVDELVTELLTALDKAESADGPVADSETALKAFQTSVQQIKSAKKLETPGADAITESYAETIKSIRQQAEEEVEIAKRRDGLEDLTVDLTSIKPSFS